MLVYGAGKRLQELEREDPGFGTMIERIFDGDPAKVGTIIPSGSAKIESAEALRLLSEGAQLYITSLDNFDNIARDVRAINPEVNCLPIPRGNRQDFWKKILCAEQGMPVRDRGEEYYLDDYVRPSVMQVVEVLAKYDVISFDIFDTLLYRKVEQPADVFILLAGEMGFNDFRYVRMEAEKEARNRKQAKEGHREILISEIYDVLEAEYDVDRKWQYREIEIELELCMANSFVMQVVRTLAEQGKKLVLMSDMYLPETAIQRMVEKCGYAGFERLYLSGETHLCKGNGSLQKRLQQDYPGLSIIHVGDNERVDILASRKAGIDAYYMPACRLQYRESGLDCKAGSFYRAVINNELNGGLWEKSLSFTHGFRIGGIMVAGFCEYVNRIAKDNGVQKILFCARDCDVIHKAYNDFYREFDNEYIKISRYAILSVTSERFLYDWAERFIRAYGDSVKKSRTIAEVFRECGFEYLNGYLEQAGIDGRMLYERLNSETLRKFISNHADVIKRHAKPHVKAAKKYFAQVIGDAKSVLIVDICWNGTCITALKYFIQKHLAEYCHVIGALLCSSDSQTVNSSMEEKEIFSYYEGRFNSMDLSPMPLSKRDRTRQPLECMFSSTGPSTIGYSLDEEGNVIFDEISYEPTEENKLEINDMHDGIRYFNKVFTMYRAPYKESAPVVSGMVIAPYWDMLKHNDYCYAVYQHFIFDKVTAPKADVTVVRYCSELFGHVQVDSTCKVSVILPSLNVAPYIRQAVNSVQKQTLREIEILCVDAGSTDGTLEILKELAAQDRRIRIIHSDVKSYGHQVNLGIDAAQGEYIGIVETDDYILPDMYADEYAIAKRERLDVLKGEHCKFTVDEDGRERKEYYPSIGDPKLRRFYNKVVCPPHEEAAFTFAIYIWSGLYSRSFLNQHNIRCNESLGASYQDNGMWLQVMMHAQRFMQIDKAYYMLRRDRADSSYFKSDKMEKLCGEFRFMKDLLKDFDNELVHSQFYRMKYATYTWAINNMGRPYRRAFLYRMVQEFNEDKATGLTEPMLKYLAYKEIKKMDENVEKYYAFEMLPKMNLEEQVDAFTDFIVYGKDAAAKQWLHKLMYSPVQKNILGCAVRDNRESKESLLGYEVRGIEAYLPYKEQAAIIITVSGEAAEKAKAELMSLGFCNIIKQEKPQYYHLFPFDRVEPGDRIVIYGAGEVGQWYVDQLRRTHYARVVAIADKNWRKYYPDGAVPMVAPQALGKMDFDKVVVSIESPRVAEAVARDLEKYGVVSEKIVLGCESLYVKPYFLHGGVA